MIIPTDCEDCGACCHSDSSTYVPLNPQDQDRLGAEWAPLTHEQEGQVYMRIKDGACVALERSHGISRCSIYARRPELCREFQQASQECRSTLVTLRKTSLRAARP